MITRRGFFVTLAGCPAAFLGLQPTADRQWTPEYHAFFNGYFRGFRRLQFYGRQDLHEADIEAAFKEYTQR